MWRGVRVSNEPVMQNEVMIKKGMFELSLFGNMDLTDERGNEGDFTEMYLTAGINKKIMSGVGFVKGVNFLAGMTSFNYPNTDSISPVFDESTVELYTGVDVEVPYGVHSKTMFNLDVDEVGGAYVSQDFFKDFGLARFSLLGNACTLVARPEVGAGWGSQDYNDYYFDADSNGISNWHTGLSLKVVSERFEFGPYVNYTELWNDDIRDNVRDDNQLMVGFGAGYRF
jgi:hypothetical protein